MTQGLPPAPTCRAIVAGIGVSIVLCLAFFWLPGFVKWPGAALTFIPSRLGLIDVVSPREVLPVDMSASPTRVVIQKPGRYALFTGNYDLLVINDAVIAAKAAPWFRLVDEADGEVEIELVERGMALFDTPFAEGRPVALFEITVAGAYSMFHPTRQDSVYIVPDYTFGREAWIVFLMLSQALIVALVLLYFLRRRLGRNRIRAYTPPTSRSREKYVQELEAEESAETRSRAYSHQPWRPAPAVAVPPRSTTSPPGWDILALLHDEKITVQDAEAEFDALLRNSAKDSAGWSAGLGLSQPEATAFSQGASMLQLVRFRYHGWPEKCVVCGQPLNYQQLDWWFTRDQAGTPCLRHIHCPPGPEHA